MKKVIAILSSTAILLSAALMPSISASARTSLEKSDREEYDLYFSKDYKWKDENGDIQSYPIDYYLDFTTNYGGTCYQYHNGNYQYVFVTVNKNSDMDKLSTLLEKEAGEKEEEVFYYSVPENQYVFKYSDEIDYKNLYDIPGVAKVELAKYFYKSHFGKEVRFNVNDTWAESNSINTDNWLMSNVKTESDVELMPEMFDDTGYKVEHVYEENPGEWLVYFDYNGIESYTEFDAAVREKDGVLSSEIDLYINESTASSFTFETIANDKCDVDGNGVVDISDVTAILSSYAENAAGIQKAAESDPMDVNGDGTVDLQDATYVLTYYAEAAAGLR